MEIIILGYLPFSFPQELKILPVKQKSPLSASGLESLAAFAYNCAPRTKMCGLLNRYPNRYPDWFSNRFPNQRVEILMAVVLGVLIIDWRFP
jgi:hypothetical protein